MLPLKPFDEDYEINTTITLARRLGASNDYMNESYSTTISDLSKQSASQVCGVWFQDALRYSPAGITLSKDVLNVYFTKPMNTSNIDTVSVISTPPFSVVDRYWENGSTLSLVVPDLSDVSYSLSFTDLTDLSGNLVS